MNYSKINLNSKKKKKKKKNWHFNLRQTHILWKTVLDNIVHIL